MLCLPHHNLRRLPARYDSGFLLILCVLVEVAPLEAFAAAVATALPQSVECAQLPLLLPPLAACEHAPPLLVAPSPLTEPRLRYYEHSGPVMNEK
jgi:hypothetical protein